MATTYSDTFTGTAINSAIWNDISAGVTQNGTLRIAANGNYAGATNKDRSSLREVIFQVVAGDRPGLKFYVGGTEIFGMTAVPATGNIDVFKYGVSAGTWTYTGTNQWWKFRWDALGIVFSTGTDGVNWAQVGIIRYDQRTDTPGHCVAISGLYINAAGRGIGTGTSLVATQVDNFTWQDYIQPVTFTTDAVVIDNCTRANENPLSNGGVWDSPGLTDGHGPCQLLGNAIANTGTGDSATTRASYGANQEMWARVAANQPATSEATIFFLLTVGTKLGYVFWIDTVSEYYVGRFDGIGTFTNLQPNIATPGGALAQNDRMGVVCSTGGIIIPAIYRAARGSWQAISKILDTNYTSGSLAVGCVRGVTYSAVGGGNTITASSPVSYPYISMSDFSLKVS